jgi:hypothetical protein
MSESNVLFLFSGRAVNCGTTVQSVKKKKHTRATSQKEVEYHQQEEEKQTG